MICQQQILCNLHFYHMGVKLFQEHSQMFMLSLCSQHENTYRYTHTRTLLVIHIAWALTHPHIILWVWNSIFKELSSLPFYRNLGKVLRNGGIGIKTLNFSILPENSTLLKNYEGLFHSHHSELLNTSEYVEYEIVENEQDIYLYSLNLKFKTFSILSFLETYAF